MSREIDAARENPSTTGPDPACMGLPPEFVELVELRGASIANRFGYFRSEPVVIFGYCPGGGEVIWKDGHSSGFGAGGWRVLLSELAPLAARHGVFLGDLTRAGTHVLVMDRAGGKMYAAPREPAQEFMARLYGIRASRRRCLCSLVDCTTCPLRPVCKAFLEDTSPQLVALPRSSHAGTSNTVTKSPCSTKGEGDKAMVEATMAHGAGAQVGPQAVVHAIKEFFGG